MADREELRDGRTAEQSPPKVLQVYDPATASAVDTTVVASLFTAVNFCCVSLPACVDTHLPSGATFSGLRVSVFIAQIL